MGCRRAEDEEKEERERWELNMANEASIAKAIDRRPSIEENRAVWSTKHWAGSSEPQEEGREGRKE